MTPPPGPAHCLTTPPTSPDVPRPPLAARPVAAQYVATFLKPEMLHIYRQIIGLRAFRPVVFCQKRENASSFPFEDLRVLPRARTRALRRLWQKQILRRPITLYRGEARHLAAALGREQAQVLHIFFGHIGVHLLPLLELQSLPTIVSFHGADGGVDLEKPVHAALTRRMFDLATLLLVRSESLRERLVAAGADAAKIRLHRTGIHTAEIPFHQRQAPPDGAWKCVQACRLIPKKGLATALRAFAEFAREYPRASFDIAGDGPLRAELQALAADLHIAPQVRFHPFLAQPELHRLYAGAHLLLHPSEVTADGDQEGVPNAMLEAMATGLPVAATRHGGIPEAVEHGVSGLLTPERDAAALAGSLRALAGEPELYARMSSAAAQRVAAQFDSDAQARVLEEHYREAIARFSRLQRTS